MYSMRSLKFHTPLEPTERAERDAESGSEN